MHFSLGLPKARRIDLQQAIQTNDEISVVLPEKNLPMKFYSDVIAVGDKELAIHMPDVSWNIVDIQVGQKVLLMKSQLDKIYYTEGTIEFVSKDEQANIKIGHDKHAIWAERRLFYRFDIRQYFKLVDVIYPDGSTCQRIKGICQDVSPGGIGFKTKAKLPKGTKFVPRDLFNPVIPSMDGVEFYLEILWSKGNRLFGFNNGAIFKFPSKKEQDQFAWALDQLQINRLSWHYHNLHESPDNTSC